MCFKKKVKGNNNSDCTESYVGYSLLLAICLQGAVVWPTAAVIVDTEKSTGCTCLDKNMRFIATRNAILCRQVCDCLELSYHDTFLHHLYIEEMAVVLQAHCYGFTPAGESRLPVLQSHFHGITPAGSQDYCSMYLFMLSTWLCTTSIMVLYLQVAKINTCICGQVSGECTAQHPHYSTNHQSYCWWSLWTVRSL